MKQGSVDVTKETDLVLQQAVDLETSRMQLVQQRQQALQRFTPEHPAIKAIDSQIAAIEHEEDALKKRSSALPETQQEGLSLMRDLEVTPQNLGRASCRERVMTYVYISLFALSSKKKKKI